MQRARIPQYSDRGDSEVSQKATKKITLHYTTKRQRLEIYSGLFFCLYATGATGTLQVATGILHVVKIQTVSIYASKSIYIYI